MSKDINAKRFWPIGSIKVVAKDSDAIAAIGNYKGEMVARVYVGKTVKPIWAYKFKDRAAMEAEVRKAFESRAKLFKDRAEKKAADKAAGRGAVEVGQYLYGSWGWEQTNVDFYRIEKLVGKASVDVVKVGAIMIDNPGGSSMSGKVVPDEEPIEGAKPFRVILKNGNGKIGNAFVSIWDGQPKYQSWYA